ncbi:MAG: hypothetical protein Kow0069_07460 [Promethearchaeota archaeon]
MAKVVVHFAFLFHIYQPPVQIAPVVKQVVRESYRPIIQALRDFPHAKVTLNVNGTLTEQLVDYGFDDVVEGLATLAARDQVEFTGSAKFHPLLPLIPEPEIERQIRLNDETNRRYFGKVYQPRGFFPPEMAISEEVLQVVKRTGFEWLVAAGIANSLPEFPTTFVSTHETTGLRLLFRDDYVSIDCAFDKINNVEAFANRLKYKNQDHDYYVVLAMDGETFGHHVKHAIRDFLRPLFAALPNRSDVKIHNVSELVDLFPAGAAQLPKASSWSTMPYDLDRGVPFPLWFDPANPLHVEQHRFIMYAMTLVHLVSKYAKAMDGVRQQCLARARDFLDRGIHSCQQWWASKRPWYSPEMILRGLSEVLMAVVNARRAIPDAAPDIQEAATLILDDMLRAHDQIVKSL